MKSCCLLGQRFRLLHYSISLCKEDTKYMNIKKSRSVLQTELVPRTVSEHSNSIKIISRCGFWDVNQNMNRGEDKTVYSKNLEQYLNMDQRGMWGQHTGLGGLRMCLPLASLSSDNSSIRAGIIRWEAAALCDTWGLVVPTPVFLPLCVCIPSIITSADCDTYRKKKVFKNEYLYKVKCFLIWGI